MDHVIALQQLLQVHIPWNRARVNFTARFVVALITMSSVNFTQLALVLNPGAATLSNYRRLQRFFNGYQVDRHSLTRFLLMLLPQQGPWVLTMDRTMWRFGGRYHNILLIGVCADGIAIPLVWRILPKEGCSNTKTRIALLEELFQHIDPSNVAALVADREFVGSSWLRYLKNRGLRFAIRIRKSLYISTRNGRRVRAHRMVAHLKAGQVLALRNRRLCCGQRLFVCAIGPAKGHDPVILLSSEPAHRALAFYRKRWQVETFFAAIKSRGFNLEATHISDPERIAKLMGLLAIAFTWAYRVGLWVHQHLKPIAVKSHGRRAQSLFRYGLDRLREAFITRTQQKQLAKYIQILSCT